MPTGIPSGIPGQSGGFTGGAANSFASGRSGDASGLARAGGNVFNIGGNPNTQSIDTALLTGAALIALFIVTRQTKATKK